MASSDVAGAEKDPRAGPAQGARCRLLGDSFCFACHSLESRACRHSVTLLQSLDEHRGLVVSTDQGEVSGKLLMVAPLVERSLRAAGIPFLLIDVEPLHWAFRRFVQAADARVRSLDHLGFNALRSVGTAFLADALAGQALDKAIRHALGELVSAFAPVPDLDPRVRWMMVEIQSDPSRELTELAAQLGLSVEHASRLFSAQAGLSLRVYALSCKIRLAARHLGRGHSLTEVAQMAGFSDSAHFAKVWTRCYGASPSAFFPPTRMKVDQTALPGWIEPPAY